MTQRSTSEMSTVSSKHVLTEILQFAMTGIKCAILTLLALAECSRDDKDETGATLNNIIDGVEAYILGYDELSRLGGMKTEFDGKWIVRQLRRMENYYGVDEEVHDVEEALRLVRDTDFDVFRATKYVDGYWWNDDSIRDV